MNDKTRIAEIRARLADGPLAKWDSRERCEFEKHSPADIRFLLDRLDRVKSSLGQLIEVADHITKGQVYTDEDNLWGALNRIDEILAKIRLETKAQA